MATSATKLHEVPREEFALIAACDIAPSATNPRKAFSQAELEELAHSIENQGIMQPLVVRTAPSARAVHELMDDLLRQQGKSVAKYEIVTGERRWRAAQLAGLAKVPCIVREMDDCAALDAQIAENLQRSDITPLEEAHAYRARLKAAGDAGQKMNVGELAARIGKSRRYVYDKLQLLDLADAAKKALERGAISAAYASEIVRLKPELQDQAVAAVASGEVRSVKDLREWISYNRDEDRRAIEHLAREPGAREPGDALKDSFKLAATIKQSYSGDLISAGKIRAPYLNAGMLWCATSSSIGKSGTQYEAYRLLGRDRFKGKPRTYAWLTANPREAEKARRSVEGFYHGVPVKYAGRVFVLSGPPALFRDRKPKASACGAPKPSRLTTVQIKKHLDGFLKDEFGRGLRVARISQGRERGKWIAVLVQASAQRKKKR